MNNLAHLLKSSEELLKAEQEQTPHYDTLRKLVKNMMQTIMSFKKLPTDDNAKLGLIIAKGRLDDVYFDIRSLKKEVAHNGRIDLGNIDAYDDYAVEDTFKNTHILVDDLKELLKRD